MHGGKTGQGAGQEDQSCAIQGGLPRARTVCGVVRQGGVGKGKGGARQHATPIDGNADVNVDVQRATATTCSQQRTSVHSWYEQATHLQHLHHSPPPSTPTPPTHAPFAVLFMATMLENERVELDMAPDPPTTSLNKAMLTRMPPPGPFPANTSHHHVRESTACKMMHQAERATTTTGQYERESIAWMHRLSHHHYEQHVRESTACTATHQVERATQHIPVGIAQATSPRGVGEAPTRHSRQD